MRQKHLETLNQCEKKVLVITTHSSQRVWEIEKNQLIYIYTYLSIFRYIFQKMFIKALLSMYKGNQANKVLCKLA